MSKRECNDRYKGAKAIYQHPLDLHSSLRLVTAPTSLRRAKMHSESRIIASSKAAPPERGRVPVGGQQNCQGERHGANRVAYLVCLYV